VGGIETVELFLKKVKLNYGTRGGGKEEIATDRDEDKIMPGEGDL
jgi:hypothetical protein